MYFSGSVREQEEKKEDEVGEEETEAVVEEMAGLVTTDLVIINLVIINLRKTGNKNKNTETEKSVKVDTDVQMLIRKLIIQNQKMTMIDLDEGALGEQDQHVVAGSVNINHLYQLIMMYRLILLKTTLIFPENRKSIPKLL